MQWSSGLINSASFMSHWPALALFYDASSCFSHSSPFVSKTGNRSGSMGHLNRELIQAEGLCLGWARLTGRFCALPLTPCVLALPAGQIFLSALDNQRLSQMWWELGLLGAPF